MSCIGYGVRRWTDGVYCIRDCNNDVLAVPELFKIWLGKYSGRIEYTLVEDYRTFSIKLSVQCIILRTIPEYDSH